MRIANDTCEVMVGEVERPDTIMNLNETDWLAFVEGTLDPVNTGLFRLFRRGLPAQSGSSLFPDGTSPDAARGSAVPAGKAPPLVRTGLVLRTESPGH